MLATYQTQLQALIQAPNSPTSLVPAAVQTAYINTARNQLAADAECIRTNGTLATVSAQQSYSFSAITLPANHAAAITIRSVYIGALGNRIDLRPWEWFQAYYLTQTTSGTPTVAAQQGQGTFGTLFLNPIPNAIQTLVLDCVCLPISLVDDTTVEVIPPLWQDAVPFYAAWLAMQSLQRQADAEAMLRRYLFLSQRGRQFATPSELPENQPGGIGAQIAAAHRTLGQFGQSGQSGQPAQTASGPGR